MAGGLLPGLYGTSVPSARARWTNIIPASCLCRTWDTFRWIKEPRSSIKAATSASRELRENGSALLFLRSELRASLSFGKRKHSGHQKCRNCHISAEGGLSFPSLGENVLR